MIAQPVVSVRDLRVYYGTPRGSVRAVDGVSLDIGAGEVLGLVGESGCGKSTLGRGILGLLPDGAVSDGEVLYDGRNLVGMAARELRRLRGPDLGLIFQELMLVSYGGHFLGVPSTIDGVVRVAGVSIPYQRLLILVVAGFMLAATWLFLYHTRTGLAIRATANDLEVANLMGMNVHRVAMVTVGFSPRACHGPGG